METIVEWPAALDVHKAQVTACVRVPAAGSGRKQARGRVPDERTAKLTCSCLQRRLL
jgi:hypothetical protein